MKTIKYFIAALLVCLRLPAFALDDPQNGFGVGSTNFNVNPSWAIIPARSATVERRQSTSSQRARTWQVPW